MCHVVPLSGATVAIETHSQIPLPSWNSKGPRSMLLFWCQISGLSKFLQVLHIIRKQALGQNPGNTRVLQPPDEVWPRWGEKQFWFLSHLVIVAIFDKLLRNDILTNFHSVSLLIFHQSHQIQHHLLLFPKPISFCPGQNSFFTL